MSTKRTLVRLCLAPILMGVMVGTAMAYSKPELVPEIAMYETVKEALEHSQWSLAFRSRYEDVSQKTPIPKGAQAATLRSRVAMNSARYHGFYIGFTVDDVRAIPDDSNYASGLNDQVDDLAIPDASDTRVSAGWVGFNRVNTLLKYGKQSLELGNGRLIGQELWRQHSHAFTGLSFQNDSLNYTQFRAGHFNRFDSAYLQDTNRQDDKRDSEHSVDIDFFQVSYRGFWLNQTNLYGLTIDAKNASDQSFSTETYGINSALEGGDQVKVSLFFDYARQVDKGNNLRDYSAEYFNAQTTLIFDDKVFFNVGHEKLGANTNGFFVTPLASHHRFQGWSDIFYNKGLGNIEGGIRDRWFAIQANANEALSIELNFHRYDSLTGNSLVGRRLGKEFGAKAEYELANSTIGVKYSRYRARAYGSDQQTFWLSLDYQI